jgi:DNA-binding GntR family transcriptional regulator
MVIPVVARGEEEKMPSLGERAYRSIRDDILQCALEPGARITEMVLAEAYPFGRAAIRAAMHRLDHEGLVRTVPRHGYVVTSVTMKDVVELFEMRLLLEPVAARLAAGKVDSTQLEELDRLCNVGYDPRDPASVLSFHQANREFHLLVAQAAGNSRLVSQISGVIDEMKRLYFLGLTFPSQTRERNQGHRRLVEALKSGDSELAEREAREQVSETKQVVIDSLLAMPELQRLNLSHARSAS